MFRRPAKPSPQLILSSSSDEDNDDTAEWLVDSTEKHQRINNSVEHVRGDSPVMVETSPQRPTKTNQVDDANSDEDDGPITIRQRQPAGRKQAIFSDSEDDDTKFESALADTFSKEKLAEHELSISTFNKEVTVASTPLPSTLSSGPKKFTFKKRIPATPLPTPIFEESVASSQDDLAESLQLLDLDEPRGVRPPVATTTTQPSPPVSVSLTSSDSSQETFDLSDKTTVIDKANGPELPEVVLPRRIEPPKPKAPLQTILLDAIPQAPGSSSSQILPPLSDNYVDRALTLLSKTISQIPPAGEEAETPVGFKVNLYPHQSYGLHWLWWREHHFPGGGILADEMGLGKTVMILALIKKSLAEGSPSFEQKKENEWQSNEKKLTPSRCTLIVVPPSVLGQWENEINLKTSGLNYLIFHGPKRDTSAKAMSRYDVVLSTYSTVASEIPQQQDGRHYVGFSPLVNIKFDRIVLDEGHTIRNEKTKAAYAVCQIHANHRWVVTGTPIHNTPADMHSCVKFLRMKPFDDPKVWDYWIGLKKVSQNGQPRLNIIGRALILRRTKTEVNAMDDACPSIPPKTIEDIELGLSDGEREIYDHLKEYAQSMVKRFLEEHAENQLKNEKQRAADRYVSGSRAQTAGSTKGVTFSMVLTFLLRLRQCCVLPYLINAMIGPDDTDTDTDPDASELPEDNIISLKNPVFAPDFRSVKIVQLLEDLKVIRDTARAEKRPMDKVIIVSQWTTFLALVKSHLQKAGYRTCEITGEVKIGDRAGITLNFNGSNPRPEIMLLSLTAGGVGLNLIGANHMFFMDIHWNPQLELQAQDRIHRFGQTKEVKIYRYIAKDTMEQRVLELQEMKLQIANGLLSNAKSSVGLTIGEMRKLFNL